MAEMDNYIISTFYKFVELKEPQNFKARLIKLCNDNKIRGTILLAQEGINSTICGSRQAIDKFYQFMQSTPEFADIEYKESSSPTAPFRKTKVKVKPEIVTFREKLDMSMVGTHLEPDEWDKLISRDDAIVIDTRNDYEVVLGTFKNAINPSTRNFTDLVEWVDRNLTEADKTKPIAMFCTGGVRCEKSTAFMKQRGFKEVYHLKGGILSYFEKCANKNNMWQGKCFVFDDRIAVGPDLKGYSQ